MDPAYEVKLPGSELYGKSAMVIPFTGGDVRAIQNCRRTNSTEAMIGILNPRVTNLEVPELYNQDYWFIMHHQRINSMPDFPLLIHWDCNECSHSNATPMTTTTIQLKDLDPDYHRDGVEIDLGTETVKIRLQKMKDETRAREALLNREIKRPSPSDLTDALWACMLEPMDLKYPERYKLVKSLTPSDLMILGLFEMEFNYGVKPYQLLECESCGRKSSVQYNMTLDSFFPGDLDGRLIRSRILSKRQQSDKGELRGDRLSQDDPAPRSSSKSSSGGSANASRPSSKSKREERSAADKSTSESTSQQLHAKYRR